MEWKLSFCLQPTGRKVPLVEETSACIYGGILVLIHVEDNHGLSYYNYSNESIAKNKQVNGEKEENRRWKKNKNKKVWT